jgi:two-component system chemotaxis response regulator CheB
MIRLLIVDDSAFVRYALARMAQTDTTIEIVGTARDGIEAIAKIHELKPDVVTMDVEMPRMTGLQALQQIMAEIPTPVIMVSSLTGPGATATVRALELGAVDFFLKSSQANPLGSSAMAEELVSKVKMAAATGKHALTRLSHLTELPARPKHSRTRRPGTPRRLVIIASSTGGPRALHQVVPMLPEDLPAAVLIVQHMPAGFTRTLADRLNEISKITVREGENFAELTEGTALLAPGGHHMVIGSANSIYLNEEPSIFGLRPAADITMFSAAPEFGRNSITAVLTGMGSDGTKGAAALRARGGTVIAQEASTCIVYGMPASIVEAGLADYIIPLQDIAQKITSLCAGEEEG